MVDYANGQDITADVDLTSDLDGPADVAPNNGAPRAPAGTRVAGTDGASVRESQDAQPQGSEAPKPQKAPTVREALSAAFKGTEGQPTDQGQQQTAQQPAQDAQGRVRNPDGTFAPAPAPDAAQAQPQGQNFATPQGLPPAVAQQFAQLPAETQQFVASTMEREAQNAARYRGYDSIEQIIGPRREAWAMNGMSPEMAMNQLFALSDFASRAPEDFVAWYAGQHGIDLGVLAEGVPPVDPNMQAMQNEISRLNGQISQFTQGQQQSAHNATVQEITQFASETGQDGKPLRPYFDELGTAIMPFIQAVRAENPNLTNRDVLSQAYDRACWGTPAIREKMQKATADANEAARLASQRATAGRAQAAGSSVTGGPNTGTTGADMVGNGSVRDILKSQFAAL